MKLTINSEVLRKKGLSLGEFLVMLMGYYGIDYDETHDNLVKKNLVDPNLFRKCSIVLSDNSKSLVSQVLTESNDKVIDSGIDFENLAKEMQSYYPIGTKAGTTYKWRGTTEEIAQKLRVLVVKHDFTFTEQEAIAAVKEYVSNFTKPYTYMQLLKYFILRTNDDRHGHREISSEFMSIIENMRINETDN